MLTKNESFEPLSSAEIAEQLAQATTRVHKPHDKVVWGREFREQPESGLPRTID